MSWRKRDWFFCVILAMATLLAYQPAWNGSFIWDDDEYVTKNATLRTLDGLERIWFEVGATPQYYPLVHTTFWFEYHLWGLRPVGFHVDNVLLHALGAILLWRVLARIQQMGDGSQSARLGRSASQKIKTSSPKPAIFDWPWLVAAIFALHPVNVESVAWVTERKNVLSGVFYFASALAYLRFAQKSGNDWQTPKLRSQTSKIKNKKTSAKTGWAWYSTSFVLFLCALLSKTVACSLPAALLLVLWWKYGRVATKHVLALLPFFVAGFGMSFLTAHMEKTRVGAQGADWALSFLQRCLIAGRALWFYVDKLVWPTDLTFIYPRWDVNAAVWWQWIFPAAAVAVVAALWLLRKRIGRGPLVATLFFAGTLFPALGFINIYPMRYTFVADHYQYLAGIGVIGLALVGVMKISHSLELGEWTPGILICAVFGILTWRQSAMYRDIETLWRTTLLRNPGCSMAYDNLGIILSRTNRISEAVDLFEQALRVNPDNPKAYNNLGTALYSVGRTSEAIDQYEQALRINPNFADAHNNLGNALLLTGRTSEAIDQYEQAVRINPNSAKAHSRLGDALGQMGRIPEAIEQLKAALRIAPDDIDARNTLIKLEALQRTTPADK